MIPLRTVFALILPVRSISNSNGAIQALSTFKALTVAQSEIESLKLDILRNCSRFFPCYQVQVIRFEQRIEDAQVAIQQAQDFSTSIGVERQTMTLALPPKWYGEIAALKSTIPTQIIFYCDLDESEPDKKALVVLETSDSKIFISGADLNPGFGLGVNETAARSDLAYQFDPLQDLLGDSELDQRFALKL